VVAPSAPQGEEGLRNNEDMTLISHGHSCLRLPMVPWLRTPNSAIISINTLHPSCLSTHLLLPAQPHQPSSARSSHITPPQNARGTITPQKDSFRITKA
jgi:hypothetical protein